MLNQLSHRCAVDQTLQRTSSCTNFQKNMKQRGDDYGSTLSLLNVQNGYLLLPPTHLCSEHFRPEDFESIFGYSWDIIRWSTEFKKWCFFLKWRLVSGTQQLILLTLFIIRPVSSDQTDFVRDLTLNREPQNQIKLYTFFTPLFTLYPARISWGCFAVHTLTGTCFCTISLCIKLVPLRHLVRIPDEVCLNRRNRSDNKQI